MGDGSGPFGPVIGEPFDPADAAKNKIFIADIIASRNEISDGCKLQYDRMARLAITARKSGNPWPGFVCPSVEYMARMLGKSEPSIRRDTAALRRHKLIRVERPNRHEKNRYVFLWHAWFECSHVSGQTLERECSDISTRDNPDCSDINAGVLTYDQAECSHVSGLYKEDLRVDSREIPSSSSAAVDPPEKKKQVFPLWIPTPEEQIEAAKIIHESLGRWSLLPNLSPSDLLRILRHMTGLDDLRAWLGSSRNLLHSAKSWGRYVADAAHWPERRDSVTALIDHVERTTPPQPAEPERREYDPRPPEPEPQRQQATEPVCPQCDRDGILAPEGARYRWEWCTCSFAERRREQEPQYVDEANTQADKLRARFGAAA